MGPFRVLVLGLTALAIASTVMLPASATAKAWHLLHDCAPTLKVETL